MPTDLTLRLIAFIDQEHETAHSGCHPQPIRDCVESCEACKLLAEVDPEVLDQAYDLLREQGVDRDPTLDDTEPGPQVTHVKTRRGQVWRRNAHEVGGWFADGEIRSWTRLYYFERPLVDVTFRHTSVKGA